MGKIVDKLGLSLLALACVASAAPAFAQDEDEFVSPGGILPAGIVQSLDPADRLAMNLRLLAQNPRDVTALTQAGTSALEVGDPNAAIGFLARAEQLSPSSGRVKSALGSALTMLERPVEAIRFFNEAVAYGVPERDLWKDRGLAYDLSGDQRRAQRDYELALRTGQDAETTRRLALSFGISGDRDQALRLLEPLIKRNDQGAWRARAFVLAMTGDLKAAERIVEQVMPSGTLSPFLRRLPSLSVADRARAVNFGTMPSDGTQYAAVVQPGPARAISSSASTALATVAQPIAPRFEEDRSSRRPSREPRRRPDRGEQLAVADTRSIPAPKPVAVPQAQTSRTIAPGFSSNEARVAPNSPTPNNPAPISPTDTRVGKRLGPVEADRLPDFMRAGAPPTQIVRAAGSSLPPPDGVVPAPASAQALATVKPSQAAVWAPPPPVVLTTPKLVIASPAPVASSSQFGTSSPFGTPPPVATLPSAITPTPPPVFEIAEAKPPSPSLVPTKALESAPPAVSLKSPIKWAEPAPPAIAPAPAPQIAAAVPAPIVSAPLPPLPAPTTGAPVAQPPIAQVALPTPKPLEAVLAAAPSPSLLATTSFKPDRVETIVPASATGAPPIVSPTVTPAKLSGPSLQEAGVSAPTNFSRPVASPPSSTPDLQAGLSPLATTPLPQEQLVAVTTATPPSALPGPDAPPAPVVVETGLASVLADLTPEQESRAGPLLSDIEFRRARVAAKRKAEADALAESGAAAKEDADAKAKREAEEERKRVASVNPARVWVQIATGANRSGLPITWRKLRDTAPDALKGAAAWYAPFRATNRLLVGPYKGQSEARSLVNKLSGKGISATTFSSEAGQEIARLSSR
jgi:Flp pilus assembly protein TadD